MQDTLLNIYDCNGGIFRSFPRLHVRTTFGWPLWEKTGLPRFYANLRTCNACNMLNKKYLSLICRLILFWDVHNWQDVMWIFVADGACPKKNIANDWRCAHGHRGELSNNLGDILTLYFGRLLLFCVFCLGTQHYCLYLDNLYTWVTPISIWRKLAWRMCWCA